MGVVVPPAVRSPALGHGGPAELGREDHEGGVQQAAALEVLEQRRDRGVDRARVLAVAVLDVRVLVPAIGAEPDHGHLDEADAGLHEPPREGH